MLLDLQRGGRYLAMNQSATVLVPMLSAGTTADAMIGRLIERYGVTRAQASSDVEAFLRVLLDEHLVIEQDAV